MTVDNCKECGNYDECPLPAIVQMSLLMKYGDDLDAMLEAIDDTPIMETGLDAFLREWIEERKAETEEGEG